MRTDFHRISRLPPYVFEEVNRLKAEARARAEDIIDFGMGNPDLPTPPHIVEKLKEVDVAGVEPTAHAFPLVNVFRADEPRAGLSNDDALCNAPKRSAGLFVVPKVVE